MTVSFELPSRVAENLERQVGDLDQAAKEALLVQAFRTGKLSRLELSQALHLDRFETNAFLQRNQVTEGTLTHQELEEQRISLDRVLGPARPSCS